MIIPSRCRWPAASLPRFLALVSFASFSQACDSHSSPDVKRESDSPVIWPLPENAAEPTSVEGNPWLDTHLPTGRGGAHPDNPSMPGSRPRPGQEPPDQQPPNEEEPSGEPPELLLSYYLEGQGREKAIGILNRGGLSTDDCSVRVYANGATTPWRTIEVPQGLLKGESITFCSTAVSQPDCTHDLSSTTFNGDDALILGCGDLVHDSFGTVGEDPGTAWIGTARGEKISTKDAELGRCGDSDSDTNPYDSFDPATSWRPSSTEDPLAITSCSDTGGGGAGGAPH